MTINLDFWNLVIATVALIVSIIALAHSIYYNLVKIKISNCIKDRVDERYDWLYSFEISNLSNITVVITKIEIYNRDNKLLIDNNFDPYELHDAIEQQRIEEYHRTKNDFYFLPPPTKNYLNPVYWESSPFEEETEVSPNSRESFSYYLDEQPYKIKIYTDKRIRGLRKTQSFFISFNQDK